MIEQFPTTACSEVEQTTADRRPLRPSDELLRRKSFCATSMRGVGAAQMRRGPIGRTIEEIGIPSARPDETPAAQVAAAPRYHSRSDLPPSIVLVVSADAGSNGGDGLSSRTPLQRGIDVAVFDSRPYRDVQAAMPASTSELSDRLGHRRSKSLTVRRELHFRGGFARTLIVDAIFRHRIECRCPVGLACDRRGMT